MENFSRFCIYKSIHLIIFRKYIENGSISLPYNGSGAFRGLRGDLVLEKEGFRKGVRTEHAKSKTTTSIYIYV